MATISENIARWNQHSWEQAGHEWSPGGTAAGGDMLWWRSVLPRIQMHLPARHVLEIGPGFGRWTQHLLPRVEQLTIVDIAERCLDHCRRRFAAERNLTCWLNDGRSLPMLVDASIDFAFSFDSLVHAEAPVLRAYIRELARTLKPGAFAFIHHSNLRALATSSGELPSWVARRHWRSESMSARLFREYCREAGLVCVSQEVVNWVGRSRRADRHRVPGSGLPLTDVFSTCVKRPDPGDAQATRVYVNAHFVEEWRDLAALSEIYTVERAPLDVPVTDRPPVPVRAVRVLAGEGLRGIGRRLRLRAIDAGERRISAAVAHLVAWRVRRREPIKNALRKGRCPDCGTPLRRARVCRRCEAIFYSPVIRDDND